MAFEIVAVKALRPTQIAVGMRLVKWKRKGLRDLEGKPQELVDFITSHPIRVVHGPKSRSYIIDHHHLGLALMREKFRTTPVQVEADLSRLDPDAFWAEMEKRAWVHAFDGKGKKRTVMDLPGRLDGLEDDPYRSLAGFVRVKGGFTKTLTPYMEFQWADYFRPLVKLRLVRDDFDEAVRSALKLCRKPEASKLPGFIGKSALKVQPSTAQSLLSE
jgi:hypothetical protein